MFESRQTVWARTEKRSQLGGSVRLVSVVLPQREVNDVDSPPVPFTAGIFLRSGNVWYHQLHAGRESPAAAQLRCFLSSLKALLQPRQQ